MRAIVGDVKRTRIRRSAEDARETILEAAEQLLRETGPAGLRLQEVAAKAGIGHPTVLHHFGSRDGLLEAVVEHATLQLQRDLITSLAGVNPTGVELFERVAQTLATEGQSRIIAWLLLSGYHPIDTPTLRTGWDMIARATHAQRGKQSRSFEDTRFAIILSCLALFAQAIAGKEVFRVAGFPDDEATARKFRAWLSKMLDEHLD
jgi:AcrR family transcriptional regulator